MPNLRHLLGSVLLGLASPQLHAQELTVIGGVILAGPPGFRLESHPDWVTLR